jgi:hypothetical protein
MQVAHNYFDLIRQWVACPDRFQAKRFTGETRPGESGFGASFLGTAA